MSSSFGAHHLRARGILCGRLADVKHRSDSVLDVLGAVLMVVVMVLVVPVTIMFGGAIWSALIGWTSSEDADRHQGDAA